MENIGAYRKDGPATMLDGAASVGPKINTMQAAVLSIFKSSPSGLTDTELVEAYAALHGPCLYRSIGTRRRELVDDGILINTGTTRANEVSGRANIVWAIPR